MGGGGGVRMVTDSQNTKRSFPLNMAAVEGEHRVDEEMETKNETSKEDQPQQIALTLESILIVSVLLTSYL